MWFKPPFTSAKETENKENEEDDETNRISVNKKKEKQSQNLISVLLSCNQYDFQESKKDSVNST